jgi:hypothetical protein
LVDPALADASMAALIERALGSKSSMSRIEVMSLTALGGDEELYGERGDGGRSRKVPGTASDDSMQQPAWLGLLS